MTGKSASLLVTLVLGAGVALAAPTAAAADCLDANTLPLLTLLSLPRFESSTLCLLNQERTSRGLVALQESSKLDASSQGHSTEMRWNSYFGHDSANGDPFTTRIIDAGYLRGARSWMLGENIAWGSWILGTPASLMNAWMNSPEHRSNILEPRYREIGVGADWGSPVNPSAPASVIVTTDFGAVSGASTPSVPKKKRHRKHHHRR